jgi:hypothetical protein
VIIVETHLAASPACELKLYRTWKDPLRLLGHAPVNHPVVYPPVPHPLLFLISTSLKVELNVKNRTGTLEIGSHAPDFSLRAANREGTFTLGALLAQGTLILEFLRGTW